MKKIMIMLITALLLSEACKTQKAAAPTPPPPPPPDTTRQDVGGLQSALVLHPVENTIDAGSRKLHFIYDYPNRYLGITDNDAEYLTLRNFIPETITVESVTEDGIKNVASQLSYINPMASLTPEVKTQVTNTQGIKFTNINDYQIGKLFNIRGYSLKQQTESAKKANRKAMEMLLAMIESSKQNQSYKPTPGRIAVEGEQGKLTFHPIKNSVKGIDNKDYYFFLDLDNHCIFITDDPELYEKFSKTLAFEMTQENVVLLQGVSIDPFVFLEKNSLTQMTQELGFELDGGANNGKDINKFRVAKISNYAMVTDYPAVATAIRAKLNLPVVNNLVASPQTDTVRKGNNFTKQQTKQPPVQQPQPKPVRQGYTPPSVAPPSGIKH